MSNRVDALGEGRQTATRPRVEGCFRDCRDLMRIVLYRHSLFSRGGDRIVVQYANYLAEHGHDVTIFVNEIDTSFSIHERVRLRTIPLRTKLGTLIYGIFVRFRSVVIVDIIPLAFVLGLFHRVIYLAQAHDVLYYQRPMLRRLIAWFYHRFFQRAHASVIADSEFLASLFKAHYCASNVAVVEIGIDHGRFYPTPSHELTSSKMGRKSILILVRSDTYRKGGDIGERVLRQLCRDESDRYEIWTVGSGPVTLPAGIHVRHFGNPSDDELRTILSSTDVLLYPSRHEGFGLFPLEAMACDCLVVTTAAVPYAMDGENAYVTSPEDTAGLVERLTDALRDEAAAHVIRECGREFALGYDIRESERKFESTLRALIHGNAQPTQ